MFALTRTIDFKVTSPPPGLSSHWDKWHTNTVYNSKVENGNNEIHVCKYYIII